MMRAQLLRERLLIVTTIDRYRLKTHLARVLNAEMAQSADAVNCDHISRASTGVAEGVVNRHPRAHEWSSFFRGNFIGDRGERSCGRDQVLRITTVEVNAGDFAID